MNTLREVANLGLHPPYDVEVEKFVFDSEASIKLKGVSEGREYSREIVFSYIRAFRFTADAACTGWQITRSSDIVFEIDESDWRNEIDQRIPEYSRFGPPLRHLIIYILEEGCFEFICGEMSIN